MSMVTLDTKELEKLFKQAAELPRRRMTAAAKKGAKVALEESKKILNSNNDNYKMKFKDGNTWTKQDVIKNLTVKMEKGKRQHKRVAQITSKDWRVGLYSNFIEWGFTNPRSGEQHEALHFMRDGLTNSRKEVEKAVAEDLAKSLDKLKR